MPMEKTSWSQGPSQGHTQEPTDELFSVYTSWIPTSEIQIIGSDSTDSQAHLA